MIKIRKILYHQNNQTHHPSGLHFQENEQFASIKPKQIYFIRKLYTDKKRNADEGQGLGIVSQFFDIFAVC